MQPGLFGHEPLSIVAIEEYLVSREFMQPKKMHEVGSGVL